VGEGLQACAVIEALRERLPDAQLVFTHFSPSAERLAPGVGADVADYLPWDLEVEAGRALRALRPDVVAWVRTEAWPVLSTLAKARGARLTMLNAVLSSGSSRLRGPSRFLLGPTYRRLDAVGAVADADAARFTRLGLAAERVRLTGDARFDQVWARVQALRRDDPLLGRLTDPGVVTLVAGSTWGPDEARLIPAFARARLISPDTQWRLIVAPHEPDERHLAALEVRLSEARLPHARLAAVEAGEPVPEVVVVDRVGVLADLYALAEVAYVGGGFHSAGLHSVVEPAALGVPVVFGPRHGNAREALELEDAGAGFEVSDVPELEGCFTELSGERGREVRRRAGAAALEYVRSRLGGAVANAELVLEQLPRRRPA
jgi:3-deoxy-D-manno-octulosonic-acid transferase